VVTEAKPQKKKKTRKKKTKTPSETSSRRVRQEQAAGQHLQSACCGCSYAKTCENNQTEARVSTDDRVEELAPRFPSP